MRIVIDGNIGSGKSTIIDLLKNNLDNTIYSFIDENIEDWEEYLTEYYKDIKKNSLLFQMKVLLHHLTKKNIENKICIHERSPISCINIFGQHLKNNNFLGNLDMRLMNSYNNEYGWEPDIIIYIKTTPDIAKRRVDKRSRNGETISLEYLKSISKLYDNLYSQKKIRNIKIFTIDGNLNIDDVLKNILIIIRNI